MSGALTGRLHGTTIELDAPVPPLDGQRVRVVLEPLDEAELSPEATSAAWSAWVVRGPHGPIEDEDDAFPR